MEKPKAPSKNEGSSKSIDTKMKNTKRNRWSNPSTLKNRELPSLSHISNTLSANPLLVSVGDDITSPMKSMAISGERKEGRIDDNNVRVDHVEKAMLGLVDI